MNIYLPSFERLNKLLEQMKDLSLTRALQYEALNDCDLSDKIFDFGGGENALYRKMLACSEYISANIDPTISPTWLIKPGESLPCEDNRFDTAISCNTLEHVLDAKEVIFELYRILKPRGKLVLTVPFLFPIHGHPDDFFRPTPSWFEFNLRRAGFKTVEIIPLAFGPCSTALTITGTPGPFKKNLWKLAMLFDLAYFWRWKKRNDAKAEQKFLERYATAFFVRATK